MKKYYMLRPFYGIGITVVSFQMVIQFVLLFFWMDMLGGT